jgi:hypothetical protein
MLVKSIPDELALPDDDRHGTVYHVDDLAVVVAPQVRVHGVAGEALISAVNVMILTKLSFFCVWAKYCYFLPNKLILTLFFQKITNLLQKIGQK